jgi:uncharacterized Zn finger protein (UPF0148 family)
MSNEKAVAVIEEGNGHLIEQPAFGMTIEQAEEAIDKSLQMYALTKRVIGRLLVEDDSYYMSELKWGGERKPNEKSVVKKQGVDKLISFFKIQITEQQEEVRGGYKVIAIGCDSNGNYIASGTGICTTFEKKYKWIAADDEEYAVANEEDRREVERKGKYGKKYKVKQMKTEKEAIAHTLISMASKRARGAFLKKALPGASDFSFEGDEAQVNYSKPEPPQDQLSTDEITTFIQDLYDDGYSKKKVEEAFIAIKGNKKPAGMNLDLKDAIITYLKDNKEK